MSYDDRSVKPMSASLMRARIATKILSGLYEDVPTMLTSAIRLMVELPGGAAHSGPPYPFTIGVSPAWCSGVNGAKLVGTGKLDLVWLNPSIIPTMAYNGKGRSGENIRCARWRFFHLGIVWSSRFRRSWAFVVWKS